MNLCVSFSVFHHLQYVDIWKAACMGCVDLCIIHVCVCMCACVCLRACVHILYICIHGINTNQKYYCVCVH